MRRRLLASTLAVVVFAVTLLGVPAGILGARLVHDEAQRRLEETGQRLAGLVEDRIENHEPIQISRLTRFATPGHYIVVTTPDGQRFALGQPVAGRPMTVRVRLFGGGLVVVSASRTPLEERVVSAWLVVAALTALSIAVAVGLAILQARRLGRPLEELAVEAERFGSGDTRPVGKRYGVPEIDLVAEVLDRSAERLGDLLRREREFATDASHELRTPLTALSIRLEEISLATGSPVVREEAEAALAQVERLTGVVDALLARARDSRTGRAVAFDVGSLLAAQVREWEPAYRREGRTIAVEAPRGLIAAGTPGGVSQALAGLFDNALVHGAGRVTARARRVGEHAVVEVSDQGPGVPDDLVPRVFERSVSGGSGTGLGLALARALIEADGGRLELVHARPPVFALFLPLAGR